MTRAGLGGRQGPRLWAVAAGVGRVVVPKLDRPVIHGCHGLQWELTAGLCFVAPDGKQENVEDGYATSPRCNTLSCKFHIWCGQRDIAM